MLGVEIARWHSCHFLSLEINFCNHTLDKMVPKCCLVCDGSFLHITYEEEKEIRALQIHINNMFWIFFYNSLSIIKYYHILGSTVARNAPMVK